MMMAKRPTVLPVLLVLLSVVVTSYIEEATSFNPQSQQSNHNVFTTSRRDLLRSAIAGVAAVSTISTASTPLTVPPANAAAAAVQDSLDVENFLRTGIDSGGVMGVSSQAGKSRPETGVILRDGSEVSQDRTGAVAAEILTGTKANPHAVLISFTSPWKLETGPVVDGECRHGRTGD